MKELKIGEEVVVTFQYDGRKRFGVVIEGAINEYHYRVMLEDDNICKVGQFKKSQVRKLTKLDKALK